MPINSKVHHLYESLLAKGFNKSSAAKIAQKKTGEVLKTGMAPSSKPPKEQEQLDPNPPAKQEGSSGSSLTTNTDFPISPKPSKVCEKCFQDKCVCTEKIGAVEK